MEKIRDSVSKDLPPLRLYEDELREVHEFLSKQSKEPPVIETFGYRLASLEEISNLPETKTNSFSFNCQQPYIRVRLDPTRGNIYVGSGDVESEGIATRLEGILLRGKVFHPCLHDKTWLGFFVNAPLLVGILLGNIIIVVAGALLIPLTLLWSAWDYRFHTQHHNTIIFRLRKNSTNFWQRNKDQILLLLIGSAIGAIITLLITLITK